MDMDLGPGQGKGELPPDCRALPERLPQAFPGPGGGAGQRLPAGALQGHTWALASRRRREPAMGPGQLPQPPGRRGGQSTPLPTER